MVKGFQLIHLKFLVTKGQSLSPLNNMVQLNLACIQYCCYYFSGYVFNYSAISDWQLYHCEVIQVRNVQSHWFWGSVVVNSPVIYQVGNWENDSWEVGDDELSGNGSCAWSHCILFPMSASGAWTTSFKYIQEKSKLQFFACRAIVLVSF